MLLRFLLALIVATFAVPANAEPVCHEAPPAAAAAHHHGQPAHHQPQKQQMPAMEDHCLGCIAPATIHAPHVARPAVATRIDSHGEPLPGMPRAAVPPATPPPRSDA